MNSVVKAACIGISLLMLAGGVLSFAAETSPSQKTKTGKQFEYRTCSVQYDRVTFVNGVWNGKVQMEKDKSDVAIRSCPLIHEYLQESGSEGWELVACFSQPAGAGENIQTLFLKREK